MARAKLDDNFREELKAIEQWFSVLSDPERTTALYSLLQHTTQVQIRFFITVLQQMAQKDPLSAVVSPSTHGSAGMSAAPAKHWPGNAGKPNPGAIGSPVPPPSILVPTGRR
ncbi:Flap-structured DNA-binding and RNA-binding protein [Phlyctochytrium bullatum]|nr:Flap-structured DNA-binding and RNA-binding protein [Phlyctochytrium bullatum]